MAPAIDILKIDVKGCDLEILNGADAILKNGIKAIVMEVGYQRGDDKINFSDVENFMESRQFQCCDVYDITKGEDRRRL